MLVLSENDLKQNKEQLYVQKMKDQDKNQSLVLEIMNFKQNEQL